MKSFKKLFPFAFVFMVLVSCGLDGDEDAIAPPNFDVVALYDLVEINVSAPLDLNNDGTSSLNIVDELACLAESTLLINGDLTWVLSQPNLEVTSITGDQFNIDCIDTPIQTGTWFSDELQVLLTSATNTGPATLRISGDRLIADIGLNLPEFQSVVYQRR